MKADWNDAPARVKTKKRGIPPFNVSITATVMVFGIIAYLAKDESRVHEWLEKALPKQATMEQVVEHPPVVADSPNSSTKPEDTFWKAVEKEKNAAEIERRLELRQTVFNDQNYTPRSAINTVKLSHAVHADQETSRRRSEQVRRVSNNTLSGTSDAHFTWRDARGRVTQWNTYYDYQNSRIDNSSFCKNYGPGSIEYRTCRKAAQKWLGDRCENANRVQDEWQRMYCLAANGFRT